MNPAGHHGHPLTGRGRLLGAFASDIGSLNEVYLLRSFDSLDDLATERDRKAAVAVLSRQLAFEWGPRGVRSNVVGPGMVRTPLSEAFYQAPGTAEARAAVVPLRRVGAPEDIAEPVLFLASPRAGYVNGKELVVDGGFAQTLMSHVPRPGHAAAEGRA